MEKLRRLIIATLLFLAVPGMTPDSATDQPATNFIQLEGTTEPSANYIKLSTHIETSVAASQHWTSVQTKARTVHAANMTVSMSSPSPTGVLDSQSNRCEELVVSSVCKPFFSNRTVFFDGRFSQEQTVQYFEHILQILKDYGPPLSQSCTPSILKFMCHYLLPNCTNSNATAVIRARLCKESCESTFVQPERCYSQFLGLLGTISAFAHNNTLLSPEHVSVDQLQCNHLLTVQESNYTCFSVDLFGSMITEKPKASSTSHSLVTNGTVPASGKIDIKCNIQPSPVPRPRPIQTCGEGGTVASGTLCHFPFTYLGVEYYGCTIARDFRLWCATEPGEEEIHKQYGYCCNENLADYISSDCENYRSSNGVCDEFLQGKEVFVDLCYPQDIIANDLIAAVAKSFNLSFTSNLYSSQCVRNLLRAVCELAFPPCRRDPSSGIILPALLCKETCEEYAFGNCSSAYSRALVSLKAVLEDASSRYLTPFHVPTGSLPSVPVCDMLLSREESNRSCLYIDVDLRVSTNESITRKTDSKDTPLTVIVPITVGGVSLCLAIAVVVAFAVRRRRNSSSLVMAKVYYAQVSGKRLSSDSSSKLILQDQEQSVNSSSMKDVLKTCTYPESESNLAGTSEVTLSVQEIHHSHLQYVRDIGEGQFGQVLLASWTDGESEGNGTLVAVKVLKKEIARADFYKELSVMAQLQHENIVKLLAKCTDEEPNCMVFEFVEHGALSDFLRASQLGEETILDDALDVEESCARKHVLTVNNLTAIVCQVCKALAFLSGKRFVHRDVAARNCLVGRNLEVKLADFGLTRDIYSEDCYRVGGKCTLPVRWMPPESIIYGLFTVKSDVWAFGVLMWEVFSLGQLPYLGLSNEEAIEAVRSGQTMSRPNEFCPDDVYEVMLSCWSKHSDKRPTFNEILDNL